MLSEGTISTISTPKIYVEPSIFDSSPLMVSKSGSASLGVGCTHRFSKTMHPVQEELSLKKGSSKPFSIQ